MDNGTDIGIGDVGQDMGLWTVWVTGDRCLALVTCYNGLLQQGTNSGQTRRPIFFWFFIFLANGDGVERISILLDFYLYQYIF